MNNQQNGRVILWLTWRKYETMYQLLTCTEETANGTLKLLLSGTKQPGIQMIWILTSELLLLLEIPN